MGKEPIDDYNNIPMVGGIRHKNPQEEIMDRYEKIIYELLLVMFATEVYAVICLKWIFAIVFGIVLLLLYLWTLKEIKSIKQSIL